MIQLLQSIPSVWRKRVYAVYAVAVFVIGAIQVGFTSADAGQPTWLTVAITVAAYAGGALGFTAASNVYRDTPPPPGPEGSGPFELGGGAA